MHEADLRRADLRGATVCPPIAGFTCWADLSGADLHDADLSGATGVTDAKPGDGVHIPIVW